MILSLLYKNFNVGVFQVIKKYNSFHEKTQFKHTDTKNIQNNAFLFTSQVILHLTRYIYLFFIYLFIYLFMI